ncbi:NADPH-dependent 7-cyano-7-deazaguanine reductase [Sutterella sp.]|uniref:NADPH-dependent 7-cyano-7-deazaguanine reductase n=1 Tax=Sutterella sp. TaxID=1981025 RepID=UPI0026E02D0F|nr:NADPH-dependent 7-cyano-7-deazaguanine reductase [Sutterella sp.]MDO5532338.1 NADPH-dependent 7-cyano-7-deazaguanine reductase [Sutterella sp.]
MPVLMPEPKGTKLGHATSYADAYSPELLTPIPRSLGRDAIGDHDFTGADLWRLYEFSWLNARGLPQAAAVELTVPASTPSIIESKSLKLYAMSFAMTRFEGGDQGRAAVTAALARDLSAAAGGPVTVALHPEGEWATQVSAMPGVCLEKLCPETACDTFEVAPELLEAEAQPAGEEVHYMTNLFRSLCPVTGQPDFASVSVKFRGSGPAPASLLKYLASYRCHRGFHEQCVEQIFHDLRTRFAPEFLEVQAAFTRRGGIDINPLRASLPAAEYAAERFPRELRQ